MGIWWDSTSSSSIYDIFTINTEPARDLEFSGELSSILNSPNEHLRANYGQNQSHHAGYDVHSTFPENAKEKNNAKCRYDGFEGRLFSGCVVLAAGQSDKHSPIGNRIHDRKKARNTEIECPIKLSMEFS